MATKRKPGYYWVLLPYDKEGEADDWFNKHQPAYWDGFLWHTIGREEQDLEPVQIGKKITSPT